MTQFSRIAVVLAVVILAGGCSARSTGAGSAVSGDVPPTAGSGSGAAAGPASGSGAGAASGPAAFPPSDPPPTPAPALITPVAGSRDRVAKWHPAGTRDGGRVLLLDVEIGGPPCDTVTGIDVAQTPRSVTVTVHAGRASGATCPSGAVASLATGRIQVQLTAPLAHRPLLGSP